jgi:hypothetical protein
MVFEAQEPKLLGDLLGRPIAERAAEAQQAGTVLDPACLRAVAWTDRVILYRLSQPQTALGSIEGRGETVCLATARASRRARSGAQAPAAARR